MSERKNNVKHTDSEANCPGTNPGTRAQLLYDFGQVTYLFVPL